jgi:DNA mismatch repair protein MutS
MQRAQTPIMRQYDELKKQHPDCLLFFRLGDFYELFYEDAQIASQALDIVLTGRGPKTQNRIPMCGVPAHSCDHHIARLMKKGFKVAICEQMENASDHPTKKLLKRDVVRIITPGTLTEDHFLEARSHHFLMALAPYKETIGIGFLDLSTGSFFTEHQPQHNLASVLKRLEPKEVLLPDSFMHAEEFSMHFSEWKNQLTPLSQSRFHFTTQQDRLCRFFKIHTLKSFGEFSEPEVIAAGILLDYICLTQKIDHFQISRPQKLHQNQFLELDVFTRRNLELTSTVSGKKEGSLLSVLDQCVTSLGSRLLFLRLTHPLAQKSAIDERLETISFFTKRPLWIDTLRKALSQMPDIERAITRLALGRKSPKDLGSLSKALSLFPLLIEHFAQEDTLPSELSWICKTFVELKNDDFTSELEKALCDPLPAAFKAGEVIAAGYHEKLDEWRHFQNHQKELIESLQKKYCHDFKINTLKIKYNQMLGYFIEIPGQAISKAPDFFIPKQSLVSGMRYTTTELQDLEMRTLSADRESSALEDELFQNLIDRILELTPHLKKACRAIAIMDLSTSFADLALKRNYIRPEILEEPGVFDIQKGRHPVVEAHMAQGFISNDCKIAAEKPLWLITGPNMAGKSTFLRQNALIVIMAHIGCFVPAQAARLSCVDRVFSRIGAFDDIAKGYSTFMMEMVETAAILNLATKRSFVILDELGRGTSMQDGLALATACAEYLADHIRCRCLFATHYHELSNLKNTNSVELYTFKFKEWEEEIIFLHQIIPGSADHSYGLQVARKAGLPHVVLDRAYALRDSLSFVK